MLLNCGVGEDSWESFGLQGDQTKSILKEINPEYSLEGLMPKLKLQCFGPLMWREDSLEKTLMVGKIECVGRRGWQMKALSTEWTWVWTNSGKCWRIGKPGMLQSMGSQVVGHGLVTNNNNESNVILLQLQVHMSMLWCYSRIFSGI